MSGNMATKTELGVLLHSTDLLKCPGCEQLYQEPLILPCLHSICRPCVQNYLKTHDSHDDLDCPQCHAKVKSQQEMGAADGQGLLTENHFMKSLAELFECQDMKKSKSCDYCSYDKKTVTATGRCLECHDNLCGSCADAHRRTKLTRHHKIAAFDKIHLGQHDSDIREFQNIECDVHSEEYIKYLCKKCDQLICRECKVHEHEKHACTELPEACERFEDKNKPTLKRVKEKCTSLENYLEFLDGYQKHVTENADHVVSQIEAHAQKLHSLINEYSTTMTSQIRQAVSDDKQQVQQRRGETNELVKTLHSSTKYIDTLLQHGKPDEILHSRSLITSRLSSLVHLQADSVTTRLNQYFRAGALTNSNMAAIFGKAESFHQALNEESVKDICQDSSIEINHALPMPTENTELVREFLAKGVSDIKDIWPTGVAINKSGHMFIVDRENKRIKVFDRKGNFKTDFGHTGSGHLSCPYDIAILYNGNLAVTDYHDEEVKIFTDTGRYLLSWKKGFKYPRGITVNHKHEVVVADVNNHRVTVHNPDTGEMITSIGGKAETGCLVFTDPYYVTTNHKNYILVTDWASPNIKVFDESGKMITNYITYGVGRDRVLQPYGICMDSFGYIFVADNQNHRVHLIGPDGKFIRFLLTKNNGLWHPMALTINPEGHLVVTEALGKVKVFKYM